MIKLQMKKLGFILLILLYASQISFCQIGEQSYDIGYKSLVYQDCSRVNNELILSDSIINCRSITTSIWYPSNIKDSDRQVNFGDFLTTIELKEKRDYNPKDSVMKSADKFADYYNISKTHLSSLTNYSTQSFFNTDYLPGKFPLVIYIPGMNGFSFDNNILCEAIAKQGYVVISFNSKGSNNRWMEPNTIDYENQIRDVQYIISRTYGLSFIDNSKICLIGHSIGGYVNILTKIRDNRITSLVSLDGSIIHDLNRCSEFVYKDLNKVNCPFLSISTNSLEKARIYLDSMSYAERYYCKTSTFKHKDFKSISYLLSSSIDSIKFKDYQKLNNLIISFINKVNNSKKQHDFEKLCNTLSVNGFVTTSYLTSVPDFIEFRLMVYDADFNGIAAIYKNTVSQYPSFAISNEELYDWGNSLRFSGYFRQSIQVYKLLIDLYPAYISGYNGLARTLLLQNKNDEAIKVYKLALKIEPNNESIKRKLNKLTVEKSN
jgi:hypothetical protein